MRENDGAHRRYTVEQHGGVNEIGDDDVWLRRQRVGNQCGGGTRTVKCD